MAIFSAASPGNLPRGSAGVLWPSPYQGPSEHRACISPAFASQCGGPSPTALLGSLQESQSDPAQLGVQPAQVSHVTHMFSLWESSKLSPREPLGPPSGSCLPSFLRVSVVPYSVQANGGLPLGPHVAAPQRCHVTEGLCPWGQDPCQDGTPM